MIARDRRPARRGPLALLLCALLAGCGEPASEPRPPRLVLLFAPCTVARDALSPYDPSVTWTPHLAAFGAEALVFERHQTETGKSGIAYASLFSGTQSEGHGVFTHPRELDASLYLVTEAFADAGYETFFWGGHPMASAALRYAQGVPRERAFARGLTAADRAFRRVLADLERDPERRAFLATNFTVTHGPYAPAELLDFCEAHPAACAELAPLGRERVLELAQLYRDNFLRLTNDFDRAVERLGLEAEELASLVAVVEALYRSRIRALDRIFGGVVEAIREHGLLEESLIAFTVDHGEILFRQNALFQWTHGNQLAPEVLGVPWLLRGPGAGVPAGRYEAVTRSIDVFPTLAGLAGIPLAAPEVVTGVDLSPAVRGAEAPPSLRAYSHTALMHPAVYRAMQGTRNIERFYPRRDIELIWVSARDGDRVTKYRNFGEERFGFEVFDLASDPGETTNLYDPANPVHRETGEALVAYKERLVARQRAGADAEPRYVPDESEALLRSLGYVE